MSKLTDEEIDKIIARDKPGYRRMRNYNITEEKKYIISCGKCGVSTDWHSSKIAAESQAYKFGFSVCITEDGLCNLCQHCRKEYVSNG